MYTKSQSYGFNLAVEIFSPMLQHFTVEIIQNCQHKRLSCTPLEGVCWAWTVFSSGMCCDWGPCNLTLAVLFLETVSYPIQELSSDFFLDQSLLNNKRIASSKASCRSMNITINVTVLVCVIGWLCCKLCTYLLSTQGCLYVRVPVSIAARLVPSSRPSRPAEESDRALG